MIGPFLEQCRHGVERIDPIATEGRLTRVAGLLLEAAGLQLPVGSLCRLSHSDENRTDYFHTDENDSIEAEVVGFQGSRIFLMACGETGGLAPGMRVLPLEPPAARPRPDAPLHPWRRAGDRQRHLPIGAGLLGRVVDARGIPMDDAGPLTEAPLRPIVGRVVNAMHRDPIRTPLDTGVRSINALCTVGRGQRLGLFAGPGLGKSVLLGMMARYTNADVIVVGLVGERGREVKEFIEDILDVRGRARSVVVAAPSDLPPLLRLQGATYATAIAEHFRDQGLHVLLLMDSLTRYAMAAREIALALNEPPATKGYPPSVFARLPQLVERTGNGAHGLGSITAFYTVLAEGDDPADPVADAIRSFLDGHLVLSRVMADAGHYPAIDIERSISRVMNQVVPEAHQQSARTVRALWARYQRSRELILIGAYAAGSDPQTDRAVALLPRMEQFLQQSVDEPSSLNRSVEALGGLARLASVQPAAGSPEGRQPQRSATP